MLVRSAAGSAGLARLGQGLSSVGLCGRRSDKGLSSLPCRFLRLLFGGLADRLSDPRIWRRLMGGSAP